MADGSSPIDRLIAQLSRSSGSLQGLRNKLGLCSAVDANLVVTPLSRKKRVCSTYKITDRSTYRGQSWVVKCNPLGYHDSWYDVKQEYSILQDLQPDIPVPKPIYCSTNRDERIVGTEFIVMEFIQGANYESASEIPVGKRKRVCSSVMKAMANVHYWHWASNDRKDDFTDSSDFWEQQNQTWKGNYTSFAGDRKTKSLFATMEQSSEPRGRSTSIVHGDLDISNFIFDEQCNVKAILDWKYHTNGDPMVDVGYFLMMFLQPGEYQGCGHLQDITLLIGPPDRNTPTEDQMIQVYRREAHSLNVVFSESAFNYAKAVSCLRLITIVRAAWRDDWRGHECRHCRNVKDHPQDVIAMLTLAGHDFYRQSL